ncbi:hypothetical protein [Streptomyces humi]|nr:hypothetical protein [Streptomyces humi]
MAEQTWRAENTKDVKNQVRGAETDSGSDVRKADRAARETDR